MLEFFLFFGSLLLVIQSADLAIIYSSKLAKSLKMSKHVMGFLVISGISVLPETFVAINSALQGIPSFGVGMLFASNVADLTLVFGLIVLLTFKDLKIQSSVLKLNVFYLLIISLPILFGLNGYYSRLEGFLLILMGSAFHFFVIKKAPKQVSKAVVEFSFLTVGILIVNMFLLLLGSYFTVKYAVVLAEALQLNPILIGMFVVGLGTVLPEFLFALKAVKHSHTNLALGDVLGTVMSDATIVVGLVALITPFSFNAKIVYVTGLFMLVAGLFLFYLMRSGKVLTRKEAVLLLLFYFSYVGVEFFVNS